MNVPNRYHKEDLEAGIESCLRTIAGAREGKEAAVFLEWAGHAIRHAYAAGWEKTDIIDRLDNAGAAIGLDADVRQRILSDCILRVYDAETAGEILASMEESEATSTKTLLPLRTITPLAWKGTEPVKQRWLASGRVPSADLTILAGNGGSGKTEVARRLAAPINSQMLRLP